MKYIQGESQLTPRLAAKYQGNDSVLFYPVAAAFISFPIIHIVTLHRPQIASLLLLPIQTTEEALKSQIRAKHH